MVEKKELIFSGPETGSNIIAAYKDGWVKDPDIPYNGTYGPEDTKILHLIKYTDEEKAEIEAAKLLQRNSPQEIIDVNILSVPIIKYEDEMNTVDNPYKKLASLGWKEVHRTSTLAIMKLTDPCGVVLSSEDLTMILRGLHYCDPWITDTQSRTQLDELYVRLNNILKGRNPPSTKSPCPMIESCLDKPLIGSVDEVTLCMGDYEKCSIYLNRTP